MRHLSVALFLVAVAAYAGPEKIAIADHDGAAVVIIDASDGKALGSVSLGQDSPDRILAAPDGSRLAAISRGPGTITWALHNFRPTGHGSASIIDAGTMTLAKRFELGWDATDAQVTDDSRTLVVLSPGRETTRSSR